MEARPLPPNYVVLAPLPPDNRESLADQGDLTLSVLASLRLNGTLPRSISAPLSPSALLYAAQPIQPSVSA